MGGFFRLFWYGLLLSGGGWLTIRLVEFSDVYKVLHSNVPGPCKFVTGVEHGSEDIAVLPNGIAILSTGLVFTRQSGRTASKPGALLSFDFNSPAVAPKELKLSGFKGFLNPHGLGLYTEAGKTYVYVINHPPFNEPPPMDTVEKFLWDAEKGTLVHQKTITDPEFLGLNALVVVGMDKFYITNFLTMQSKVLRDIEMLAFLVPIQNVVYYDRNKGAVVISGTYGGNGIDVSPDKKFLYLAEVNAKRVSSYRIEGPTTLVHVDSKSLGSAADNLVVDPETGDIWAGCHPIIIETIKLLFGYAKKAPSQVLRIGVRDGKFTNTAEIYSDDGSVLSGSSVAVPYKGSVLIGTVGHKALYCKASGFNAILKLK